MTKRLAKSVLIRRLLPFVGLLLSFAPTAWSAPSDLHVDPTSGDDANDGTTQPVKTIAKAIRIAQPGDTIHLKPVTYRDWAGFFDKSGEPGNPITLDGHGATLDGCDPLDPKSWVESETGLFRNDDLMPLTDAIIDRWFFVIEGKLNRMRRCSKGPSEPLKSPQDLQPGEWTFVKDAERTKTARAGYIHGTFWLRLSPGQKLADSKIEFPIRTAGVLTRGTSSHIVVKNLTATRPYNDGFNLSDSRDIVLENIRAIDCGDDGISAHGECRYRVDGFTSIGNATGICDTGHSETTYRRVLIRDCIGFDLFFLDTGTYSVSDSVVLSSAAKAVYLQGRDKPAEPCRLTLDNVLIRRERTANEIRVSANCMLTARHVTFLNLDLQATGGEVELDHCFLGGTVASKMSRKPQVHLWKDARWRGVGNWYDLDSVRVGQSSFSAETFADFQKSVASERNGRWKSATEADVQAASIGSGSIPVSTESATGVARTIPRALFVSNDGTFKRYRIPSLIVTKKGTLLAICEGRVDGGGLTGNIDLVLRRSLDAGLAWQPLQKIADLGDDTLGNPCPVVDRETGTIWLPFTRSPGKFSETQIVAGQSSGPTTVWVIRSDDDGVTWSEPRDISATTRQEKWGWYGTGPGIGIQLANGRLLIPSYHTEPGSGMYRSHAIFSDDHGETWKLGETVGEHTAECQAIERRDGAVVLNMRGTNKQFFRSTAISRDGGQSWSEPQLDQKLPEPACQGSLLAVNQDKDGRVGNPSYWLFCNPPGATRRNLTLRVSRDEGQSWPIAKLIDAGPTEYSCLAWLPDGQIGLLYELSRAGQTYRPELHFARVPASWLTDSASPEPFVANPQAR